MRTVLEKESPDEECKASNNDIVNESKHSDDNILGLKNQATNKSLITLSNKPSSHTIELLQGIEKNAYSIIEKESNDEEWEASDTNLAEDSEQNMITYYDCLINQVNL